MQLREFLKPQQLQILESLRSVKLISLSCSAKAQVRKAPKVHVPIVVVHKKHRTIDLQLMKKEIT